MALSSVDVESYMTGIWTFIFGIITSGILSVAILSELTIIGVALTCRLGWMKGAMNTSLNNSKSRMKRTIKPVLISNAKEFKCCLGFFWVSVLVMTRSIIRFF